MTIPYPFQHIIPFAIHLYNLEFYTYMTTCDYSEQTIYLVCFNNSFPLPYTCTTWSSIPIWPLYSLVYRRGDGAVRVLSRETAVLEGLQECGGRDGDRAILRDTVQRAVNYELCQRKVQRVPRVPQSHPPRSHLQAHQALGRSSGENVQSSQHLIAESVLDSAGVSWNCPDIYRDGIRHEIM